MPSRREFVKRSGLLAALTGTPKLFGEASADGSAGNSPEAPPPSSPDAALSDLVNILQGTNSDLPFSRGGTLPIVAVPFGMAHWAMETRSGTPWYFHPSDTRLQGFRCTHQLSPWLNDYGWTTILPVTGEVDPRAQRRASSYAPASLRAHPYGISVELMRYGIRAELTATCRGSAMRFHSLYGEPITLVIDVPAQGAAFQWHADGSMLQWKTSANHGGVSPDFATYYVLHLRGDAKASFEQKAEKDSVVGLLKTGQQQCEVCIGTSFISFEQAARNLENEVGRETFDGVQSKARQAWEEHLSVVELTGSTDRQRRTFYSCLYRTLLFPRVWHEPDAAGKPVHFSVYSNRVMPGVAYADHGYWDVYRAWYPMMTLLFPDRLGEILQAWVNAGAEGGWLPQFPCPGYRACMTGSLIDSVFSDAFAKNIQGFDREAAYRLLRRHATEAGDPEKGYGRRGVVEYMKLGYVPSDKVEQAAVETLDAAYGDFCIGAIARKLGHAEDAALFDKRSRNWRNVWDPQVKFFRGRQSSGAWKEPFREYQWGDPYVEGSAWQHRWAVPHDVDALIESFGGRAVFVKELQRCLEQPARFEVGVYGNEIHEMSEMAAVPFGQYAHSNQPIHHMLYLFTAAGRPDLTHHWVHRVLDELYTPDDFCGDEDTGAMAAWFVLSSLGFYAVCPGRPEWTLGAPLFPSATIRLGEGRRLTVGTRPRKGVSTSVAARVAVDGREQARWTIPHEELLRAQEIRFTLA